MKNKIIILSGDPNSINSEIIFKCWKKINNTLKNKIYLITNYELIKAQFKKLKYSIKVMKIKDINQQIKTNKLKIINIDLKFKNPFKVNIKHSSKFIINSLDKAHELALKQNVLGIINCAINKKLLNKKKIGVTEYFASRCVVKNNSEAMLIRNKKLSVCPITTHIDIKDISKTINSKMITNKVKTINSWFKKKFKKKPKICILGLNPHNGELRKNSEEKRIIIPTIAKLKRIGINLDGPLSADALFLKDFKNYDVIIGMFHDQVLAPFKALFKFDAINITLGLKYLRVSPDHGTAENLIGEKKGNALSLIRCIHFVNKFGK